MPAALGGGAFPGGRALACGSRAGMECSSAFVLIVLLKLRASLVPASVAPSSSRGGDDCKLSGSSHAAERQRFPKPNCPSNEQYSCRDKAATDAVGGKFFGVQDADGDSTRLPFPQHAGRSQCFRRRGPSTSGSPLSAPAPPASPCAAPSAGGQPRQRPTPPEPSPTAGPTEPPLECRFSRARAAALAPCASSCCVPRPRGSSQAARRKPCSASICIKPNRHATTTSSDR